MVVITALAVLAAAVADFARAPFVLANAAELDLPVSWVPWLGALKAAGAAGLLAGLAGVPFVGVAAAAGLVLFFVGAVAVHVRARVFHNIGYAVLGVVLSAAALALSW